MMPVRFRVSDVPELVAKTLHGIEHTTIRSITYHSVLKEVAAYYGFRIEEVIGRRRHSDIAYARHVAMYLCKLHVVKSSYPTIARAMGNRDHTTVITAVRKIEALLESDGRVADEISNLEMRIGVRLRVRVAVEEEHLLPFEKELLEKQGHR